jgi:PAS domain S-box-containing protein
MILLYIWRQRSLRRVIREKARRLQASEQKYRTLVEEIREGFFIIRDGKISFVNKAFGQLSGYEDDEIVGRDFTDFIAPESRKTVVENYRKRMAGDLGSGAYQFVALHKSGKKLTVAMRVKVGEIHGEKVAFGICRDVTSERRAEEELLRCHRGLEVLDTLIASTGRSFDPHEILKVALQQILHFLQYKIGFTYIRDEDHEAYVLVDHQGLPKDLQRQIRRWDLRKGLIAEVQKTEEPAFFESIPPDSNDLPGRLMKHGIRSFAAFPIRADSDVLGLIGLGAFEPTSLTPEERQIVAAMSRVLGMILFRTLAYSRVSLDRRKAEVLSKISNCWLTCRDWKEALERIVETIAGGTRADCCALFLTDPGKKWIEHIVEFGIDREARDMLHDLVGASLDEFPLGKVLLGATSPIALDDLPGTALLSKDLADRLGIKSLLCVPLSLENRQFVALFLAYKNEYHPFARREIELARLFAAQIKTALDNGHNLQRAAQVRSGKTA